MNMSYSRKFIHINYCKNPGYARNTETFYLRSDFVLSFYLAGVSISLVKQRRYLFDEKRYGRKTTTERWRTIAPAHEMAKIVSITYYGQSSLKRK